MSRSRFHQALALPITVIALALAACDESSTGPGAQLVETAFATVAPIRVGAGTQLRLDAIYSDGSVRDVTHEVVRWSSSLPGVASVSGTGHVGGIKPGSSVISATFGGRSTEIAVQVTPSVQRITFDFVALEAIGSCEDIFSGAGDYSYRITVTDASGTLSTIAQTNSYPNSNHATTLAVGSRISINKTVSWLREPTAGTYLEVVLRGTEWDYPPFSTPYHDSKMSDLSTSGRHQFDGNAVLSSTGERVLTLGNSACGLRLRYRVFVAPE